MLPKRFIPLTLSDGVEEAAVVVIITESTLPRLNRVIELEKRRIQINIDVISGELTNG